MFVPLYITNSCTNSCVYCGFHISNPMKRTILTEEEIVNEYKAIKRYWKLIQQDSRKLSDKRFYRPTFRMHLTNKEIIDKLLSYSEDLKHHYNLYQLLLFHFQNKESDKFFWTH